MFSPMILFSEALNYRVEMFTHFKLCLATATHYLIRVKTYAPLTLANLNLVFLLTCLKFLVLVIR